MKLSAAQQEVIDKMRSGWELGCSESRFSGGRAWLQRGGVGNGGETQKVSRRTVDSLEKARVIERHYSFPTAKYSIPTPQEVPDA